MKNKKIIKRVALVLLLALLVSLSILPAAAERQRPLLLVGGMPFGVRYTTEGIMIVGYCDVESSGRAENPARAAGLCPGDCIIKINEAEPSGAAELSELIAHCAGQALDVCYLRDGVEGRTCVQPLPCDEDGRFRLGLFVRDSGAGIGTVTFLSREGNVFAGLGHGICDGESGALVPLARGSVMGVRIGSVRRGAAGAPGELKGHFSDGKLGTLLGNTVCGVYGVMAQLPTSPVGELPIAYRNEVRDGAATLWCTLEDNVPHEYAVTLSHIHRNAEGNKCFTVKVTDEALLARTGGIVQGMSGSPIIQNGKLVGAVTHVLIGDPTTGYGIFIENMLANIPAALG